MHDMDIIALQNKCKMVEQAIKIYQPKAYEKIYNDKLENSSIPLELNHIPEDELWIDIKK